MGRSGGAFHRRARAKEICIRKVLGATVANITLLLSRDFLVLVVLAIVIASPVAWYFADQWLEDYAFRAPMNVWVIVEAGCGYCIALVTVSVQALRAARSNPSRDWPRPLGRLLGPLAAEGGGTKQQAGD